MKLRWPRRQPQQRDLTLSEKILLERSTERMLERLRIRVTEHKCPACGVLHGGPGA